MGFTCRAYCSSCDRERMFERPEVNHRLQLILTVVTLGLWGISWLALCARGWLGFWECRTCHSMKRLSAKLVKPKETVGDES